MRIAKQSALWTEPTAATGGVCGIAATHTLTHSRSNRFGPKLASAVASCVTTRGQVVQLCGYCKSYVETLQWLARIGYRADVGTGQLAALAYVWRAEDGFVMPAIRDFAASHQTLGMVAHHLNKLIGVGLVKRSGNRYLLRDACPACYRRVYSAECQLRMSLDDFVPRRPQPNM